MKYTVPASGAAPICVGLIRAVNVTDAPCATVGLEDVTEVLVLIGFTVSWSVAEEVA